MVVEETFRFSRYVMWSSRNIDFLAAAWKGGQKVMEHYNWGGKKNFVDEKYGILYVIKSYLNVQNVNWNEVKSIIVKLLIPLVSDALDTSSSISVLYVL